MIRNTVVGISGMSTLISPTDTLIVPKVRHSHSRTLAGLASDLALCCRQDGVESDMMFGVLRAVESLTAKTGIH